MSQYTNKGLYNGYDKNNKEREALDYYATPTKEVTNILNTLNLPLRGKTILEPCCGGGHMVQGIIDYLNNNDITNYSIYATDIKDRNFTVTDDTNIYLSTGKEQDFFLDNYGSELPQIDYIIMNPPYSVIEPFIIRALEIPTRGVLMLGRLQFLEGLKRYKNIFSVNPPTDVYVYINRIACYRNGNVMLKADSAQAYAWFYWDLTKQKTKETMIHWIYREE